MIQLFGSSRRERRDVAELLREMPGMDAWREARARGKDMSTSDEERGHWWRVAGRIDRVLQINWNPDTAGRYLESR